MGQVTANGINLAYDIVGEGDPVLLICGTGQPAVSWQVFMVPALVAAGYKVVTFDNRGMPPSDCPPAPYSVDGMVQDTAGLIEALEIGPCRVIGYSLGAFIAQELSLARPDLVSSVVLMGTVGRQNAYFTATVNAVVEFDRSGIELPAAYAATVGLGGLIGPHSLANDDQVNLYLAFTLGGEQWANPGRLGQHEADAGYDKRLEALGGVTVPTMVIVFELDATCLAPLGREVAAAIPGARLVEIAGVGHFGPFEAPDEVNKEIVGFLAEH
ncbi:MAG TPA: alpha/beta hydrolase [Acidimicrobiales bacterium]|nr:alpha/beta hydrolase [Acidimicrobiales bacterium]